LLLSYEYRNITCPDYFRLVFMTMGFGDIKEGLANKIIYLCIGYEDLKDMQKILGYLRFLMYLDNCVLGYSEV
jgi:hypothetical protein